MTFWQEVTFGVGMLALGLALEFLIDVWRERYLKGRDDPNERHIS